MTDLADHPEGTVVTNIDGEVRLTNPTYGINNNITPEIGGDALGVIIPTVKGRRIAYGVYVFASVIAGAALNYCAVTTVQAPSWLLGVVSTVAYLGGAFGLTAIANLKGK